MIVGYCRTSKTSQELALQKDALEKYGQKATFFVVGQQAEYYSDFLRREVELGMEVGNHTWDHPWLNQLSEEEIQEGYSLCEHYRAV